jgi:hypothetical protein
MPAQPAAPAALRRIRAGQARLYESWPWLGRAGLPRCASQNPTRCFSEDPRPSPVNHAQEPGGLSTCTRRRKKRKGARGNIRLNPRRDFLSDGASGSRRPSAKDPDKLVSVHRIDKAMPRRPRLDLPGVPMHLMQRGVNRAAVFMDDEDPRALPRTAGVDVGRARHRSPRLRADDQSRPPAWSRRRRLDRSRSPCAASGSSTSRCSTASTGARARCGRVGSNRAWSTAIAICSRSTATSK